jgi:hypothetical protein
MLNLIVTICNDYKTCLSWQHLDATSDGAVLPDAPPNKQMQLLIGPLYNQMQPVMGPLLHKRCNKWWGDATSDREADATSDVASPQPDASSDGAAPQPDATEWSTLIVSRYLRGECYSPAGSPSLMVILSLEL